MIWKPVRDTKQQNKSHNVPCYTSIPELITKFKTFSTRSKSKTPCQGCISLFHPFPGVQIVQCAANLESRKRTRGERDRGGKAFGISFKKVILPTLSGAPFFIISNLSESLGFGHKS